MAQRTPRQAYYIGTADGNPSMPVMHYHETYDIYYIESGSRSYFVEDKFFTVSPGDLVLIPPFTLHRIGEGRVLRTLISFTEEFLQSVYTPPVAKQLTACFEKAWICPASAESGKLKALLHELSAATDPTAFGVHLAALLLQLGKCRPEPAPNDRVSGILRYINQNYSDIRSLDQIAAHAYLSKQHLCRLFKNATGVTPVTYLNQVRIKNSCTLLESSDKSMTEICGLCGFSSYAYFSTLFKRTMGMSPLTYRQSKRR